MRTIRDDPRCDAYMDGLRPYSKRCSGEATIPSGLCLFHAGLDHVYIAVGGSADSPSLLSVRGLGRRARAA
ncbi:MAG: hypothetical protein ACRD1X_18025 [Vicinamibacteria bacterium]